MPEVGDHYIGAEIFLPREEHLEAAVHVMVIVGQKYNSRLVHNPSYPEINHSVFKECGWPEFYRDTKEAIPMNAPEPHGKEVDTRMFVDSDHAGDKVSCRSRIREGTWSVKFFMIFMKTISHQQ